MRYTRYESPIGRLLVAKDDVAVRHVSIPDRDPLRPDAPRPGRSAPAPSPSLSPNPAGGATMPGWRTRVAELEAYFAGRAPRVRDGGGAGGKPRFGGRCGPRSPRSPTARRGATASSRGARAFPGGRRARSARRNGANPVAIVLPCHRVIGADGRLVGYGGGLDRKARLLAHERGEPVFAALDRRAP